MVLVDSKGLVDMSPPVCEIASSASSCSFMVMVMMTMILLSILFLFHKEIGKTLKGDIFLEATELRNCGIETKAQILLLLQCFAFAPLGYE